MDLEWKDSSTRGLQGASTFKQELVRVVFDRKQVVSSFQERIRTATKPHFMLCLAGTGASDLEGISAAGATPAARRLTPAIDAEALATGRCVSAPSLPVSPLGIVSPVVISRAMLQLTGIEASIVDCGSFIPPAVPHIQLKGAASQCPSSGRAMQMSRVQELFQLGQKLGAELSERYDLIVIAECVPGGTTTALGTLTALGFPAEGRLSSSLPVTDHGLRQRLITDGLRAAGLSARQFQTQPLLAPAAVGDPMQPFVAGVASVAAVTSSVVLGGGSQMLAVDALLKAIAAANSEIERNVLVATTKWVAFDAGARSADLAQLTDSVFIASCPDFKKSRHYGLQAYEEGNVKEGVGAGAAMAVANLRGFSCDEILAAIDNCYDEMVLGKSANLS